MRYLERTKSKLERSKVTPSKTKANFLNKGVNSFQPSPKYSKEDSKHPLNYSIK